MIFWNFRIAKLKHETFFKRSITHKTIYYKYQLLQEEEPSLDDIFEQIVYFCIGQLCYLKRQTLSRIYIFQCYPI